MVAARSAAMGFNRLVDARFDALNPRTALREIPSGALSRTRGDALRGRRVGRLRVRVVATEPAVRPVVAGGTSRSCSGIRSPSATRPTRRRSSASRWRWRRLVDGWRPAAVGGREPWLLGLAIGLWVGGFDILYACQDVDFDRAHGLQLDSRSFRRRARRSGSRARCTSRPSSCMAALGLARAARPDLPCRRRARRALLFYEQSLVRSTTCRR